MKDGLLLLDENGWAVANLYSYCELLKWLLVEYLGISYDEASRGIESRSDYFENFTVFDVLYEVHNWPFYYAAMDLYFGDETHQAKTVIPPPDTPEGIRLYCEIEKRIREEHHLELPFDLAYMPGWMSKATESDNELDS